MTAAALQPYQKNLALETLYAVAANATHGKGATLGPYIEIYAGTVDIYMGSQDPGDSSHTNLTKVQTGFAGIYVPPVIPTYLYIHSASGAPVIVVNCMDATATT
jgi:hypothetical protein